MFEWVGRKQQLPRFGLIPVTCAASQGSRWHVMLCESHLLAALLEQRDSTGFFYQRLSRDGMGAIPRWSTLFAGASDRYRATRAGIGHDIDARWSRLMQVVFDHEARLG